MADKKYDYLIVGSGFYGSVCAYELSRMGKKVLVIEKRNHIGGNAYTKKEDDIDVHEYGAHIFHTNDKAIWKWIQQFGEFNNFRNSPLANYKDEIYSLPFSMWTFYKLWGVTTPEEAKKIIESQRYTGEITNLEEQALSLVGKDVYEKLIKGYTEKQWKKSAKLLPASIIKRLPVRFTWDNNYFNDKEAIKTKFMNIANMFLKKGVKSKNYYNPSTKIIKHSIILPVNYYDLYTNKNKKIRILLKGVKKPFNFSILCKKVYPCFTRQYIDDDGIEHEIEIKMIITNKKDINSTNYSSSSEDISNDDLDYERYKLNNKKVEYRHKIIKN